MMRSKALAAVLATLLAGGAAAADTPWQELGRQGLVRVVIVPVEQARDRAAYTRQIALLCPGTDTCFVNFFSNSTGAELALPLPDAVAREATAVFRRSAKQGAELLRWACRLEIDPVGCF